MARARMLHRSIAIDSRFNGLSMKEQWVFMRLLPFADDEGKLSGNTTELRALTMPLAPIRNAELEKLVNSIAEAGLIEYDSGKVIQYRGWSKNQKIGHRPAKSNFPDVAKKYTPFVTTKNRFKKASSGLFVGYCGKCGKEHYFDHEWQARKTDCCGRSLTGERNG